MLRWIVHFNLIGSFEVIELGVYASNVFEVEQELSRHFWDIDCMRWRVVQ